jgi:hypothetical protein
VVEQSQRVGYAALKQFRDWIEITAEISRNVQVMGRLNSGNNVIRSTDLRPKDLNACPCRFDGFDKNKPVFVRDYHVEVLLELH